MKLHCSLPIIIASAIVVACLSAEAGEERGQPTREQAAEAHRQILARLRAEGLTKDKCYLKGRLILGSSDAGVLWPYSEQAFPYHWDFSDGTLCGAVPGEGVTNPRVEHGVLTFRADKQASFACYPCKLPTVGDSGKRIDASSRGEKTAFAERSVTKALRPTVLAEIAVAPGAGIEGADNARDTDTDSISSYFPTLDADAVAVHSLSGTKGVWQYSTDGGETWEDVGEVSEKNALLLSTDDKLRFSMGSALTDTAHLSWGNIVPGQAGLLFGYNKGSQTFVPVIKGVRLRMRQSLRKSRWTAYVKPLSGERSGSDVGVAEGTDWQVVTIPFEEAAPPPYTGVRVETSTLGNEVEIDWVEPCVEPHHCYRKEITLPAAVRWAKCSLSAEQLFRLRINGKTAVESPPNTRYEQIWNYELDPNLFRKGKNVIGAECSIWWAGMVLVDGALLCEDGTYVRLDSDKTWKSKRRQTLADRPWTGDWSRLDRDASAWKNVREGHSTAAQPEDEVRKYWFNPSWKGRLMVSQADGRAQPVYGSREDVAIVVRVPAREGGAQAITWELYDEMGDGFHAEDRLVKQGRLELLEDADDARDLAGVIKFRSGELPHNHAYALVLRYREGGREIEKCRYELAVCGPVEQPVVENPTKYTDGMDLKLVWELDASDKPPEGKFISCNGVGEPVSSPVITTRLGRFRQTNTEKNDVSSWGGGPANYISFKYAAANPGRPHVAIAEYPDDTIRCQEMRLTEAFPAGTTYYSGGAGVTELGNHTVVLGVEAPLSHQLREHHVLFFPSEKMGTVTFFSIGGIRQAWRPECAARVGRVRIYEILNDVPARKIVDAPGEPKWIGQQHEAGPRQVMQSCFASPIHAYFRTQLIASEAPYFYRNWMVTCTNQIKRMRFAGENAFYGGQFMYDHVLYPSVYSDTTAFGHAYAGSLRDYGVLMARMFEENGMALFSGLEMLGVNHLTLACSDDDVARGVDTLAQVDKHGRQQLWRRSSLHPNWIRPEARKHFETVIHELIGLYGKEKGWKGIEIQVNEVLGPSWISGGADPWLCSYDDYTIALFEKGTGIRVPVDRKDRKRFGKRHAWLLANARQAWTSWRTAKMTELYEWLRDRLKREREDLTLVFFPQAMSYIVPSVEERPEDALPSIFDYSRRGGMDLEHVKTDPDMILAMNVQCAPDAVAWMAGLRSTRSRYWSRTSRFIIPFSNDGQNGLTVRYNWYEAQPRSPPGWVWDYSGTESWPYPEDRYFGDYWVNAFIRSNPSLIVHSLMDATVWMGREPSMSRFAQAFRSIPVARYTRLTGNGRDRNVWIQTARHGEDVYGYVANPQWWDVKASLLFARDARVTDLMLGKPLKGNTWDLGLPPYTIRTFRVNGRRAGDEPVLSCSAEVSSQGQAATLDLLKQYEALPAATRPKGLRQMLEVAHRSVKAGDYSTAFDTLVLFPAVSPIVLERNPQTGWGTGFRVRVGE